MKSHFACFEFWQGVFNVTSVFPSVLQPKVEEELSGDKVLESEQEKMSHGFQLERDPSELRKAKPVEENGEQEAEPVRNGAESVSEGEGTDANSGFTESSSEGPVYQYKPGKSRFRLLYACLVFCLPPSRAANAPCILPAEGRVFPVGLEGGTALHHVRLRRDPLTSRLRGTWGSTRGKLFFSRQW